MASQVESQGGKQMESGQPLQSQTAAGDDCVLFSPEPVVVRGITNPVIVVGLPRSGSSFLAYVMSQIEDLYVFDDFYLYREVRSLGIDGPIDDARLKKLVYFLGWVLRARVMWPSIAPPKYTLEDIDRMCEVVEEMYMGKGVLWHELMEEWLTRLAKFHGRSRWGYKAPQDFMHLPMLQQLYPDVRFIFLIRDPRRVMASMKFIHADDGTPLQYHPWAYAYYWKMAAESMIKAKQELGDEVVCELFFEKLKDEPEAEAKRLAEFLGMRFGGDLGEYKTNTSFAGKKPKDITPTEKWMCERIAGQVMVQCGYDLTGAKFRLRDLPDLAWITMRFTFYQMKRIMTKKSGRESVKTFVKNVFNRKR